MGNLRNKFPYPEGLILPTMDTVPSEDQKIKQCTTRERLPWNTTSPLYTVLLIRSELRLVTHWSANWVYTQPHAALQSSARREVITTAKIGAFPSRMNPVSPSIVFPVSREIYSRKRCKLQWQARSPMTFSNSQMCLPVAIERPRQP